MTPEPDLGALTYVGLRRGIGVIAFGLPFALVTGQVVLDGNEWPGSISAYYYTSVRNIFVGALCSIAMFLFSYRYRREDNRLSTLAAVLALGVAMFPTANPGGTSTGEEWVRVVHLGSAALFFFVLAWFSLVIFTKTDPGRRRTSQKRKRDRVYRICGTVILCCLALAVVHWILEEHVAGYPLGELNALFWLETFMIWAFGVSWAVKGELVLPDA